MDVSFALQALCVETLVRAGGELGPGRSSRPGRDRPRGRAPEARRARGEIDELDRRRSTSTSTAGAEAAPEASSAARVRSTPRSLRPCQPRSGLAGDFATVPATCAAVLGPRPHRGPAAGRRPRRRRHPARRNQPDRPARRRARPRPVRAQRADDPRRGRRNQARLPHQRRAGRGVHRFAHPAARQGDRDRGAASAERQARYQAAQADHRAVQLRRHRLHRGHRRRRPAAPAPEQARPGPDPPAGAGPRRPDRRLQQPGGRAGERAAATSASTSPPSRSRSARRAASSRSDSDERAQQQHDQRDPHHDRLLERHHGAADVLVGRRRSGPSSCGWSS